MFGADFMYCENGYYEREYWYDEYWDHGYYYDGYWVYYPHGYYCVHYVWWYPWWWDYYWWRCRWCHHFYWDFYYAGFYVMWYESGCWWFRPRYGRWVRYRVPYTYHEIRHHSQLGGINLPPKPPREINVPYNENEVMRLTKEKDPELYREVEKEHKTGNLQKMQKDYQLKVEKQITQKNAEYKTNQASKSTYGKTPTKTPTKSQHVEDVPYKTYSNKTANKHSYYDDNKEVYKNNNDIKSPGKSDDKHKAPTKYKSYDNKDVENENNTKTEKSNKKTSQYQKDGSSEKVMKNPYDKPKTPANKPTKDKYNNNKTGSSKSAR